MTHILHELVAHFQIYGYIFLFLITFVSASFVPIPTNVFVATSIFIAAQDHISIFTILIISTSGYILGNITNYYLARRYGKPLLSKLGLRRFLESKKFAQLQEKIRVKGPILIFISRFELTSNLLVNIISGITRVKFSKYLFFMIIGEIGQSAIFGSMVYFFGAHWSRFLSLFSRFFFIIIIFVIVYIIYNYRKKKRLNSLN